MYTSDQNTRHGVVARDRPARPTGLQRTGELLDTAKIYLLRASATGNSRRRSLSKRRSDLRDRSDDYLKGRVWYRVRNERSDASGKTG
ncbi:hypothetical protein EVAR_9146_1 [Eumeta japonica]|uniref:Uncharacterized protein n=1 Tax=Eumeta variegata TaxID=151549 RepID=A0A4C1TW82_EUMVA|nr:hypothetical protein EVAR_9146_1 [Eumeta japonica]